MTLLWRLWNTVRTHPWMTGVLCLALLVRIGVFMAYGPAFHFSDTRGYFIYAEKLYPSQIRPYGYSLLLNIFQPTGSVWPVVILQTLLGLATGTVIYAFLQHKLTNLSVGWRTGIAVAASVPVLFDVHVLAVEHYIISDTLFLFCLVTGFVVLLWGEKLSVRAAVIGGLLLAAAILTRTVGAPLVGLILVYLIIRRVGWKPFLAFAGAAIIPMLMYMQWFHHYYGKYSFSTWQDRWIYGRMMSIADCSELELNDEEKVLCERASDPKYVYDVNFYVWSEDSPAIKVERKHLYTFSAKVLTQQPWDFTKLVTRETWAYFSLDFYMNREAPRGTTCPQLWELPNTIAEPECAPRPVSNMNWGDNPGKIPDAYDGKGAVFFDSYSRWVTTPGPLLGLGVLLVGASVVAPMLRRGRGGARLRWDAVLLTTSAVGLLVAAVASSQFEIRYGLPAVALIPIGAALAADSLRITLRKHESIGDEQAHHTLEEPQIQEENEEKHVAHAHS